MSPSLFFTPDEFKCHCKYADCDAVDMDPAFLRDLNTLRNVFGLPMLLRSAVRCRRHNKDIGGEDDSWHPKGKAVDVHCPDGVYMLKLVKLALQMGFRVGIRKRMVHLDKGDGPQVMFGY